MQRYYILMKSNVILKGFFAKVVLVPLWNWKPNQFIQKYYPVTLAAADSTCLENVNTRKCEVIWSQTENWKLIYLNKEGHKDTLHLLTRQPVIISEGKKHWSFCENRGNKVILKPWSSPVKCTITPCYTISLSKRSSKPTTTQLSQDSSSEAWHTEMPFLQSYFQHPLPSFSFSMLVLYIQTMNFKLLKDFF